MLSVSGITLTNDKYRRKNCHSITEHSCFQTHLTLSYWRCAELCTPLLQYRCFLKNEPIILRLTYFNFHRTVLNKKYLEEFDGKLIFLACLQNGSQTGENFVHSKIISVVLISPFRGLLIIILTRIKCNEEYQVINCCFFKLTLY